MSTIKAISNYYEPIIMPKLVDIDLTTIIIDMAGIDMGAWEGVMFIVPIKASLRDNVITLKARQNSINSKDGMKPLKGQITRTCNLDGEWDNKVLVLSICKPSKRYIDFRIVGHCSDIGFRSAMIMQFDLKQTPTIEDKYLIGSNSFMSPDEENE